MRPCECCASFAKNDFYRFFQDRCPWCQARLIQVIQRTLPIARPSKAQWCTEVIARADEWALDQATVRAMAKANEWAVQPDAQPKINGKKK